MSKVLLDTNVASFIFARDFDSATRAKTKGLQADLYDADIGRSTRLISFQTVAEMLLGARLAGWGAARRASLRRFLSQCGVVALDRQLVDAWVDVMEAASKAGLSLSTGDAWVAASARRRGVKLVAHDRDLASLNGVASLTVVSHVP